jgi:hypothetical protein
VGDAVHAGGQTFLELLPRTQQKCAHRGRRPEGEIAMDFRTILVPIEQHDLMNSTLETALLLARKFDSYIEGLIMDALHPVAERVASRCAEHTESCRLYLPSLRLKPGW